MSVTTNAAARGLLENEDQMLTWSMLSTRSAQGGHDKRVMFDIFVCTSDFLYRSLAAVGRCSVGVVFFFGGGVHKRRAKPLQIPC